jgi:hypothetical protein
VIAGATAMQESGLRDLAHGDADSVGLFQQRPSAGWGSRAKTMDPIQATNAFLDELNHVPGWPLLPLTVASQDVQHSAFPDAYANWEPAATQVVNGLLARPDAADTPAPQLNDSPGLLAVGGDQLAQLAGEWPTSFQGGPITVDTAARTDKQIQKELTSRQTNLPGTLVIDPSPTTVFAPSSKHHRGPGISKRLDAIMRIAGPARTVYWITVDPNSATPLRAEAAKYPRLQLLDIAAQLGEHPDWTDNGQLNEAGLAALRSLVGQVIDVEAAPALPTAGPGCGDGLDGYGSVPVPDCGFQLARGNPRSCRDAVRWALAQSDGPAVWHRKCLHFVARAYGWAASGIPNAGGFWAAVAEKHLGDPNPPAGALVFWSTSTPDGHVAISVGGWMVVSNDIAGAGSIAAVPLTAITARWHATYLGWAPPLFAHGL